MILLLYNISSKCGCEKNTRKRQVFSLLKFISTVTECNHQFLTNCTIKLHQYRIMTAQLIRQQNGQRSNQWQYLFNIKWEKMRQKKQVDKNRYRAQSVCGMCALCYESEVKYLNEFVQFNPFECEYVMNLVNFQSDATKNDWYKQEHCFCSRHEWDIVCCFFGKGATEWSINWQIRCRNEYIDSARATEKEEREIERNVECGDKFLYKRNITFQSHAYYNMTCKSEPLWIYPHRLAMCVCCAFALLCFKHEILLLKCQLII